MIENSGCLLSKLIVASGLYSWGRIFMDRVDSLRIIAFLRSICFALACVLWIGAANSSEGEFKTYVEFLWSRPSKGAIARQQTRGFVLEGNQRHQICVAVLDPQPVAINVLRIDAIDASGRLVSRKEYEDFHSAKRCYDAWLGDDGVTGEWTFNVYLDGTLAASRKIEVASSLQEASFYASSDIPYVLGRPNYDPEIAPHDFTGRLVWVMHVDEAGAVTRVEIEAAEGVGVRMRERAIAAGYMSLFPPDPSRTETPFSYRRELNFRPD